MTQRLPLPLTAAMLATANAANEGKPRYTGAGVAGDWNGGAAGNDVNTATANVALASSAATAAADSLPYTPRQQTGKASTMVPSLTVLADLGKDYGAYTGLAGRTGTIQPREPYPSVLP